MTTTSQSDHRVAYSVAEAAELLGFSAGAMYQKVCRREVPSMRVGRSVRIPAAFIDRFRIHATADPTDPTGPVAA